MNNICAICLEDVLNDKIKIPCLYTFHKNCFYEWLDINNSYPVCRIIISKAKLHSENI